MVRLLLICLGGAIGTAARYGLSTWCRETLGAGFPYGTLAVNVIGSFLLGVIMYVGLNTDLISPDTRLVLGTGVIGGFTTYSSFNYETVGFVGDRAYLVGAVYVSATLLGCFVAGSLGVATARWAVGR
jgi:fluoride exporter